jgi:hypothetical protein
LEEKEESVNREIYTTRSRKKKGENKNKVKDIPLTGRGSL